MRNKNARLWPKRISFALVSGMIILFVPHVAAVWLRLTGSYTRGDIVWDFIRLFDFNSLYGVRILYSAILFFFIAFLLYRRAGIFHPPWQFRWIVLGLVFTYCGLDELSGLHERISFLLNPLWLRLHPGRYDVIHLTWIIPYGIAFFFFAVYYFRFLLNLSAGLRTAFILAAALFITGAIVLEVVETIYRVRFGENNITYVVLYTLEELLEWSGQVVLIYGLLRDRRSVCK